MKKYYLIAGFLLSLFFNLYFILTKYNFFIDKRASFANLSINSRVFNDNLNFAHKKIEENLHIIKQYIIKNGIKESELKISPIKITDNKNKTPTYMYFETIKTSGRFEAKVSMSIHSSNINLLKNLQSKMIYKYINEGKVEKGLEGINFFTYEGSQDGDLLIYNKNSRVINKGY